MKANKERVIRSEGFHIDEVVNLIEKCGYKQYKDLERVRSGGFLIGQSLILKRHFHLLLFIF